MEETIKNYTPPQRTDPINVTFWFTYAKPTPTEIPVNYINELEQIIGFLVSESKAIGAKITSRLAK